MSKPISLLAWLLVLLGAASAVYGICAVSQGSIELKDLGGYLSGTSGSAWALAALLFVYQSTQTQSSQLRLQQREIADQSRTFQIQQFEQTFFQMLGLHNDIVDAIDLSRITPRGDQYITKGRDCFGVFYTRFRDDYNRYKGSNLEEEKRLASAYQDFYKLNQAEVGHYFRNMYTIVKIVDQSDVLDKQRYVNILRAQLSVNELALLTYNCLSGHGREKFKPLVVKYRMLKNLPKSLLISEEHADMFGESGVVMFTGE